MFRTTQFWIVMSLAVTTHTCLAQGPGNLIGDAEQVLTQGPIHEAFAAPVVYDPRVAPIIPKLPPALIEELPPDQRPEGANVEWIPGYWAWDDERKDFLWISGVWRNIPPGRQWVPGYWHEVSGGVQWVPGSWFSEQNSSRQYLPQPPVSLEAGPNSPAPSAGSVWAPGSWVWSESRYYWRPGFWILPQPNWVWIPAQYSWTPSGYLYSEGYWDRPLATRGQLFAPVYYSQPVYLQPSYVYRPTVGIVTSGLMVSLFVRPSCHVYYFGDYYAPNYSNAGYYPWHSYQQTRVGYDPLFSYYSVTYRTSDPGWHTRIREEYVYRREHVEARPARTYVEMNRRANTNVTINNVTVNNINVNKVENKTVNIDRSHHVQLAQHIDRIAAGDQTPGGTAPAMKFQRLQAGEQRENRQRIEEMRNFQAQRSKSEMVAAKPIKNGEAFHPRVVEAPKSPIVRPMRSQIAANPQPNRGQQAIHHEPPSTPTHPTIDRDAKASNAPRPVAHGTNNPGPGMKTNATAQPLLNSPNVPQQRPGMSPGNTNRPGGSSPTHRPGMPQPALTPVPSQPSTATNPPASVPATAKPATPQPPQTPTAPKMPQTPPDRPKGAGVLPTNPKPAQPQPPQHKSPAQPKNEQGKPKPKQ
jgi:hypothetical protein